MYRRVHSKHVYHRLLLGLYDKKSSGGKPYGVSLSSSFIFISATGLRAGNDTVPIFTPRHNAHIASAVLATTIPSVTRRYCVKTTARSTVQFALLDSKMCLVL